MRDTYDYIVVGAGTAGCALARRLTEGGRWQVLLIEDGPLDRIPLLHVPAGFNSVAFDPRVINDYKTLPEPGLGGRVIDYVRGRVLGGSSSVNAMVHVRGQREDYDGWACPGWSWDDVLPYFRRSESHPDGASAMRGGDGPLRLSRAQRHPTSDRFIQAMMELGSPLRVDFDDGPPEGAGYYYQAVHHGRRQSAATAYLRPRPRNLDLVSNTAVQTLTFDGTRATGIRIANGAHAGREIRAHRELILCAGTVGDVLLLERSGIGDAARLSKLGITPRLHAPEVGEQVQDHYQAPVVMSVRQGPTLNTLGRPWNLPWQVLRYALRRDGLLAFNAMQAGGFVRSVAQAPRPDLQVLFAPGALDPATHPRRFTAAPGVTAIVYPLQPRSRGSVHLALPGEAPRILGNYLTDPADAEALLRGIAYLRRVFSAPAWKNYGLSERAPGPSLRAPEEILDFCRRKGDSVHHPVGSCRMGTDARAVVDPQLRVRGVDGLRIADAAVMPRIVSANTNAATLMIAEKAADLVLGQARP
ncbi:GMC family oxidoreductase N-terminal domain-containing protein [Achromobacter marplatensis]|uniref:GMC family oxidoreductase n=1 Tax=Achromobacter marplatensis TaxID=470868 RepID=UPI0028F04134|nr:GMC family oxidoreductase N-terminal domain-containing protein [Achromobacter marplatensis]